MENDKYKNLIISYLEDNIRDEDLVTLLNWLDENPANKNLFFEIKDIWDSRYQPNTVQLPARPLWKKSISAPKESKLPRWRKIVTNISKYAAIVAITITATMLLQKERIKEVTRETAYHQVLVQNGKQSQLIVLSDGTKVWINASSSLKYPESFDASQRTVWLDGEAYFEVVENATHPFVVRTGTMDIKVLGTHFNVTAYGSDPKITTTLVEGKVELWTGAGETAYAATLEPNQQAVYLKDENRISLRTVDPSLYTAWKDGYYKFYYTSFGEIAERLEKMYNVKIVFTNESLRQIPYSGTFAQEQSLREVLEIIRDVKHFNYTIKDNQITINK